MAIKRDNAGLEDKVALRKRALQHVGEAPYVLEVFAGKGKLYDRLYRDFPGGVALEKNEEKAFVLALQRPSWRVYECDSIACLRDGLCADVPFTFVDFDPYGEPWPALEAFLLTERERPRRVVLAVNDGLRRNIKMNTAWKIHSMQEAVREFGHDLHDDYLSVCRWLLTKKAGKAGYDLARFEGFHAGYTQHMTHYYAVLEKSDD